MYIFILKYDVLINNQLTNNKLKKYNMLLNFSNLSNLNLNKLWLF